MQRSKVATWTFLGGFLLGLSGVLVIPISLLIAPFSFTSFAITLVFITVGCAVMLIGLSLRTEPRMHFEPGAYGDDAGSVSHYPPYKPLSASERRKMEKLERE